MMLFSIVDTILFVVFAFSVLYLFVFALFSMSNTTNKFPHATQHKRFVVLIPAYGGDDVVVASAESALAQEYPSESFSVVVIADHLREDTIERLRALGVKVLVVEFENSSKAKAMAFAVQELGRDAAEAVAILDVDNIVQPSFLSDMNDAFACGCRAVQCHRTAKNRDTDMAVLDAASEEMNNSIFRAGHTALGLSSALIGSGMAFDYGWFCDNVVKLQTTGEDKELERLLLREGVYVAYLPQTIVLDEKVQRQDIFYNQRRRWIASQVSALRSSIGELPSAVWSGNWDYADKILQWMMLPRVILLGLLPIIALCVTIVDAWASVKWWAILLVLCFAFAFAIPDAQMDDKLRRAIRRVPITFCLMFANLFRVKGAHDKFIRTEHGSDAEKKARSVRKSSAHDSSIK